MEFDITRTERRLGRLLLAGSGLAHLLVPGLLLGVASVAYDRTLDVRFDPGTDAEGRVRLVGVALLAAAVLSGRRT